MGQGSRSDYLHDPDGKDTKGKGKRSGIIPPVGWYAAMDPVHLHAALVFFLTDVQDNTRGLSSTGLVTRLLLCGTLFGLCGYSNSTSAGLDSTVWYVVSYVQTHKM